MSQSIVTMLNKIKSAPISELLEYFLNEFSSNRFQDVQSWQLRDDASTYERKSLDSLKIFAELQTNVGTFSNAFNEWANRQGQIEAENGKELYERGVKNKTSATLTDSFSAFSRACSFFEYTNDLERWQRNEKNKATVLTATRKWSEAKRIYQTALSIRPKDANEHVWAELKYNLGYVTFMKGLETYSETDLRESENFFLAALSVHENEPETARWASTQNSLGAVYSSLGNILGDVHFLQKSIHHYEKSLTSQRRNALQELCRTRTNIANSYFNMEAINKKKHHILAAKSIMDEVCEALNDHPDIAEYSEAYKRIGNVYFRLGEIEQNSDHYKKALEYLEIAQNSLNRGWDPKGWAEILFQRSLATFNLGITGRDHGAIEHAMGALREAEKEFADENQEIHRYNCIEALSAMYARVGVQFEDKGATHEAIKGYRKALLFFERESYPMRWSKLSANLIINLSRAASREEDYVEILDLAEEFLDEAVPMAGLANSRDQQKLLAGFASKVGAEAALAANQTLRLVKGLDLLLKSRAIGLRLMLKLEKRLTDTSQDAELAAAKANWLKISSGLSVKSDFQSISSAYESYSTLLKQHHLITNDVLNLDELVSRADKNAAIVVLYYSEKGGGAFIIGKQFAPRLQSINLPLLTTKSVDSIWSNADPDSWLRAMVNFQQKSTSDNPGERKAARVEFNDKIMGLLEHVWDILMGPIHDFLSQFNEPELRRILLSAPGKLSALPLHAARCRTNETYLIERYATSFIPSIESSVNVTQRHHDPESDYLLAIVGANLEHDGKVYPEDNPAWDHFHPEKRQLFQPDCSMQESLAASLEQKNYLSTFCHGFWDISNPELSYLDISDGKKIHYDTLRAVGMQDINLVVLSACDAALSDISSSPDEFIGFATAILSTGARCVVAPLWAVEKTATFDLVSQLFDLHLNDGLPPADALQKAQLEFLSTGQHYLERYPDDTRDSDDADIGDHDPYFWAGFSITGN